MDSSTATTVLLVEDNEDVRGGLSTLLESDAGVHNLHKPLDIDEFLRAVQAVLASASPLEVRLG